MILVMFNMFYFKKKYFPGERPFFKFYDTKADLKEKLLKIKKNVFFNICILRVVILPIQKYIKNINVNCFILPYCRCVNASWGPAHTWWPIIEFSLSYTEVMKYVDVWPLLLILLNLSDGQKMFSRKLKGQPTHGC